MSGSGGPPWSPLQAGVQRGQLCLLVPALSQALTRGRQGLQVWIGLHVAQTGSAPLAELETGTDSACHPAGAQTAEGGRVPEAVLGRSLCMQSQQDLSAVKAASGEGPVAACWPLT